MRYVILRDDDTNALTPVECLERLYRPFLDRGLPVNLATIPEVSLSAKMQDGRHEGFLLKRPVVEENPARVEAESVSTSGHSNGKAHASSRQDGSDATSQPGSCMPLATNCKLTAYL